MKADPAAIADLVAISPIITEYRRVLFDSRDDCGPASGCDRALSSYWFSAPK